MFDLVQFISDCKKAVKVSPSSTSVREVVGSAVSEHAAVRKALGEPQRAEMQKLYQSPDLTILNVLWAPWMTLLPHNHKMWAVIGIYTGREDNIFWRRQGTGKLEAAGARALSEQDAVPLGPDIIHSVTNPIPRLTGAIHSLRRDFFAVPRSEWDSETLLEERSSGEKMLRRFEEANARLLHK